jgi:hypothetical protein
MLFFIYQSNNAYFNDKNTVNVPTLDFMRVKFSRADHGKK